jgi:hypothetical protein
MVRRGDGVVRFTRFEFSILLFCMRGCGSETCVVMTHRWFRCESCKFYFGDGRSVVCKCEFDLFKRIQPSCPLNSVSYPLCLFCSTGASILSMAGLPGWVELHSAFLTLPPCMGSFVCLLLTTPSQIATVMGSPSTYVTMSSSSPEDSRRRSVWRIGTSYR